MVRKWSEVARISSRENFWHWSIRSGWLRTIIVSSQL